MKGFFFTLYVYAPQIAYIKQKKNAFMCTRDIFYQTKIYFPLADILYQTKTCFLPLCAPGITDIKHKKYVQFYMHHEELIRNIVYHYEYRQ